MQMTQEGSKNEQTWSDRVDFDKGHNAYLQKLHHTLAKRAGLSEHIEMWAPKNVWPAYFERVPNTDDPLELNAGLTTFRKSERKQKRAEEDANEPANDEPDKCLRTNEKE